MAGAGKVGSGQENRTVEFMGEAFDPFDESLPGRECQGSGVFLECPRDLGSPGGQQRQGQLGTGVPRSFSGFES